MSSGRFRVYRKPAPVKRDTKKSLDEIVKELKKPAAERAITENTEGGSPIIIL